MAVSKELLEHVRDPTFDRGRGMCLSQEAGDRVAEQVRGTIYLKNNCPPHPQGK